MSSQETWLRQAEGERGAWLLPTWNGRPRVNKPPMLVWLNLLCWAGMTPENSTVDDLIGRSRLLAAGLALSALAGVYWMAHSLAGHRVARLALLVTGSFFLFIRQARMATYDTHMLGWITLAVASGIWACGGSAGIQAIRRRRFLIGWMLCAIFLGAGLLTKGPIAGLFVVVPLALFVAVFPERRRLAVIALLVSTLAGFMMFAAWYGHVFLRHPYVYQLLVREYGFPSRAEPQPFWYYAGLIGLVFPWTFCLIQALFFPGVKTEKALRRVALFAWFWLVAQVAIMSIPDAKNQRYIVPVLPSAGLLVALQLSFWEKSLGRRRLWITACFHGAGLAIFVLGVPIILVLQPWFAPGGSYPIEGFPHLPGIPAWLALVVGAVGIMLWIATVIQYRGHHVDRAATLSALTVLFVSTMAYHAYAVSEDNGAYPHRFDAACVAQYVEKGRLFYLSRVPAMERIDSHLVSQRDLEPSKEFLIYYRGIMPPASASDIRRMAGNGEHFYLAVRGDLHIHLLLDRNFLVPVFRFEDGDPPGWTLFEANAHKGAL